MTVLFSALPLLLLASSALCQHDFDAEGHVDNAAPHQSLDHEEFDLDYHAHPKYAFDYSVKDPHTGDDKNHWETRDGDKVKGTYTVLENDGTKRIVEYEADDKNGFNAVVHRIGSPKIQEEYQPIGKHYEATGFQKGYQVEEGFVPIVGGYGH